MGRRCPPEVIRAVREIFARVLEKTGERTCAYKDEYTDRMVAEEVTKAVGFEVSRSTARQVRVREYGILRPFRLPTNFGPVGQHEISDLRARFFEQKAALVEIRARIEKLEKQKR